MAYLVRPICQQTARASIVPSAVDRGQLVTGRKGDDRVAMPQRSYARLHHQSAIRGERLTKERLRCHGLDASLCRRIHFRRMPSVNDGPPDSGFAATSLVAGSPSSRINCSAASRSARSAAPSPQLRVLPVRKPPSLRSWQLLALPPWPLRARPCGRLHAPPSPPPRVVRVRQPRSSLSQRLTAMPASPPPPPPFPHPRAPPSRQLYAS